MFVAVMLVSSTMSGGGARARGVAGPSTSTAVVVVLSVVSER